MQESQNNVYIHKLLERSTVIPSNDCSKKTLRVSWLRSKTTTEGYVVYMFSVTRT